MNEPEKKLANDFDRVNLTEKQRRNFWAKIDKNGPEHPTKPELGKCWLWTAGKWARGYGAFFLGGRQIKSHRLAYLLTGNIPKETPFVLHSCDVRLCCNPAHLFLGTYTDNALDMCNKGRHRVARGDDHYLRRHPECILRGTQLPQTRLSDASVIELRERHALGIPQHILAEQYSVSRALVCLIVNRKIRINLP